MKVRGLKLPSLMSASETELICLTMVSAGLDTVPANLIQAIAYLASPDGQRIQNLAYASLLNSYESAADACAGVLQDEKVPIGTALVKETLRYYIVIAMSLPRESIKPIRYKDSTIPAGTLFGMNARAAYFDNARFMDPYSFDPNRYIKDHNVSPLPVVLTLEQRRTGSGSAPFRLRCRLADLRRFPSCEPGTLRGRYASDTRVPSVDPLELGLAVR
jgi:cytochrome P450